MSDALIDLPQSAFTTVYDREPLAVHHRLCDHVLLTREAIARLADWLPPGCIERNKAQLPLVLPGGGARRGGVDAPSNVVQSIDRNDSWLVLWNIEQHPDYQRLLDECLDPVERMLPSLEGGMVRREAFLFVSSPGSLTPVHFDPEHNFLLQITGTKNVHVGSFSNSADQTAELERYYRGGHRNLDVAPTGDAEFRLQPGDGVYIPSHAPHWVSNGDEASVSLSITFHTPPILRRGRVHLFNAAARRLGVRLRPPGQSPVVDRTKSAVIMGLQVAHRGVSRLGGFTPKGASRSYSSSTAEGGDHSAP